MVLPSPQRKSNVSKPRECLTAEALSRAGTRALKLAEPRNNNRRDDWQKKRDIKRRFNELNGLLNRGESITIESAKGTYFLSPGAILHIKARHCNTKNFKKMHFNSNEGVIELITEALNSKKSYITDTGANRIVGYDAKRLIGRAEKEENFLLVVSTPNEDGTYSIKTSYACNEKKYKKFKRINKVNKKKFIDKAKKANK